MSRSFDKAGRRGAALLAAIAAAAPIRCSALDSPGCMAGGSPAMVAGVDAALDIHLADGRVVHLPGIAAPVTGTSRLLEGWLTRVGVTVAPLRAEPDRWGRTPALVFASAPVGGAGPVSVTEALIEAGRVLARPDPELGACWTVAVRLEREAERRRAGLWAEPPVLAPGDAAGLRAHAGMFSIVAGRIATVREGRARTYLRFADDHGTGLAVALTPSLAKRAARAGIDPHALVGRRVRVRGLLDDRWGWQIEPTEPQALEPDGP